MKPFFRQFRVFCITVFSICFIIYSHSQVGIGTTTPNGGAILDIESADKGILIPRLDLTDLITLAPLTGGQAVGLLVYNTNSTTGPGFFYWNSNTTTGSWIPIAETPVALTGWSTTGNAATVPGTAAGENYLGTSDAQTLVLATAATRRLEINAIGQVYLNRTYQPGPFSYDKFLVWADPDDVAIRGYANSGNSIAVWGENEFGGRGVNGTSRTDTGVGVFGSNGDGDGIGVQGVAFNAGNGVEGSSNSGYAVFANGTSGATGTKSFVIDDPRDPANKILKHFSIESNEVLNLYRGTNTFDNNGKVVVTLPDYYDAINKNAAYQLTPVGAAMPNLYIEKELKEGAFTIAGGIAGKKVSWIVTGERNDPYLKQNPDKRDVEVDKGKKRGQYLTPELYNQPNEKSYSSYFKNVNSKE